MVDDAIVVGENIYYHHQDGLPFHQAAIRGAQQIAMPVCFSILTNIVAFMPLYFVPGIMGKFFQVIPLVVCSTFFISLIESLFILPAHLAHQKNQTRQTRLHQVQLRFGKAFDRLQRTLWAFLERSQSALPDRDYCSDDLNCYLGLLQRPTRL